MFGAALRDGRESGSDLNTLHGVDAHHRRREVRIELAVDRLAPTHRDAARADFDTRAARIAGLAQAVHERLEFGHGGHAGDEEWVCVDMFPALERDDVGAKLREMAANANTVALGQPFPGDGAGGNAHRGLARRLPAAAAVITNAVFLPIRVIGVARPERVGDVRVILAARILVADEQRDRRAGRAALENSGEDFDGVRLASLRDMPRSSRTAAVEFMLDVGLGKGETRWAAVDDAADRGPMRFAAGRDAEQRAERVPGHG